MLLAVRRQLEQLMRRLPDLALATDEAPASRPATFISGLLSTIDKSETIDEVRAVEAQAATGYWTAGRRFRSTSWRETASS